MKSGLMLPFLLIGWPLMAAEPVRYNRDVRPILSDNCFACHGPDKANRKGDLRLDDREAAIAAGAIKPSSISDSTLLDRILTDDTDDIMPPPKSHKTLSTAQKDILKRWVAEGAPYEKHWAFLSPQPISVPAAKDFPGTDQALLKWPRNEIDWFILRGLVKAGLEPSPEAEDSTLARRIALDLTGLPAQADVLKTFDKKKLDAYIDAHFASPHYGERMAVDWLDAARFADTQGYQVDRDQDMSPWRDWVIEAYNRNLPFDQFTIEQLAGDLLPNATLDQRVATGFHRNHMVNQEGGIIAAEFIAEYTADRVETTAAVWMGQTFNCARCHDHKFDPFTQRDFYAMKAFFANVGEQGGGNQDTQPLPSPEIENQLAPLLSEVLTWQGRLDNLRIEDREVREWADRLTKKRLKWEPFEIATIKAPQGKPTKAGDSRAFDLSLINREGQPVVATVKLPAGRKITALRVECATEADGATIAMGRVMVRQGKTSLELTGAVEGVSRNEIESGRLLGTPQQAKLTLNPGPNKPAEALVWLLEPPLQAVAANETVDFSLTVTAAGRETEWRLFYTEAPVDQLVAAATIDLAGKESDKLSKAETGTLRREYQLALAESREARSEIADLNERIAAIRAKQPTAVVMKETPQPKDTFILMRGAYDKPGEKVAAATPVVLPPLAKNLPVNRLGLARWLVSQEHPLTARVTVNRLWQSVFGTGLVRTSEDFGSQGEPPSHPELLDWLAGEFVRSGWDTRHLLRLMLTSATYRQSSRVSPGLLAADPENRLLSRGPRFRLHAEFVRDQALSAAGLLSDKIGGKSVKPYHPPGLYELVTAGSTTNVYVEDKGEGLRRRSLYTYWKRSVPHPAMITFDAPGREVCALRRPRSNTPLQALNLMNDPVYVEAARHLAHRMILAAPDLTGRIQFGYRTLLAREASAAEMSVLTRAFERNRADFAKNPAAAAGLLKLGAAPVDDKTISTADLAAMTNLANMLLCLDETITKE
jgi:mono/diheme cytochrome c family protein